MPNIPAERCSFFAPGPRSRTYPMAPQDRNTEAYGRMVEQYLHSILHSGTTPEMWSERYWKLQGEQGGIGFSDPRAQALIHAKTLVDKEGDKALGLWRAQMHASGATVKAESPIRPQAPQPGTPEERARIIEEAMGHMKERGPKPPAAKPPEARKGRWSWPWPRRPGHK